MCSTGAPYVGCKGLYVAVGSITVGVLWVVWTPPRPAGFQALPQVEAASLWVQSGLDYMVQRVPRLGPAHWLVELDWGTWLQGPGDPGLVLSFWRLEQCPRVAGCMTKRSQGWSRGAAPAYSPTSRALGLCLHTLANPGPPVPRSRSPLRKTGSSKT